MTCHVFVFGKTLCLLLREDHDFRCCQVTFNILDADKAESYSGEPHSLGSSVGHVTVFLDLRIGFRFLEILRYCIINRFDMDIP